MARTKRTTKSQVRTFEGLATRARGLIENAGTIAMARVNAARDVAMASAGEARNRTAKAVSQLEHVFEQRVTKVVRKLGVPSNTEVRALARQVAELQVSVERLRRSRARARA
jgi:poly(hydroxyalkanoate) granule-associated protein